MRKIINISIFAIAGLAVLLSLIFALGFNQETKDKFDNAIEIKANNPQMLTDLENATVESLPNFIAKYEADLTTQNAELKKQKIQRDIFYTFIYQLGEVTDQASLDNFIAKFPNYSKALFASANNKEYFINGFNKVKTYSDFQSYYKTLQNDYDVVNQEYLAVVTAIKAQTTLFKQIGDINAAVSMNKKQFDLHELQKNISSYKSGAVEFNITMNLFYILFIVTFAAMIIFLLWNVFINLKSNFTLLLGVGLIILIVIIGYFISSPELSAAAIKEKLEPSAMKWVGAGLFTFYCTIFGAIATILITLIHTSIKKAK